MSKFSGSALDQLKFEYDENKYNFEEVKFQEVWHTLKDAEIFFCRIFFGTGTEDDKDKFRKLLKLDLEEERKPGEGSPRGPLHWLHSHFMWRLLNLENKEVTEPSLKKKLEDVIAPEDFAQRLIGERDPLFHEYISPEKMTGCLAAVRFKSKNQTWLARWDLLHLEGILVRVVRGYPWAQIDTAVRKLYPNGETGNLTLSETILLRIGYKLNQDAPDLPKSLSSEPTYYPLHINLGKVAWILHGKDSFAQYKTTSEANKTRFELCFLKTRVPDMESGQYEEAVRDFLEARKIKQDHEQKFDKHGKLNSYDRERLCAHGQKLSEQ